MKNVIYSSPEPNTEVYRDIFRQQATQRNTRWIMGVIYVNDEICETDA